MKFLSKLLKKEEAVSRAEHEQRLALIAALENDVLLYQRTIRRLRGDLDRRTAALEHWEKYGQLRDPATGRLIPKAREKQAV